MISKTDILKMVRQVHRQSRGLPPRRLIYPAREWGRGVVIAILLLGGAVAYSTFQYRTFNTINSDVEPAPVETVRYKDKDVDRVIELYAARAGRFDSLNAAVPVAVVDTATTTASSTSTFTEPAASPESANDTTDAVFANPEVEPQEAEETEPAAGGVISVE